MTICKIQEYSTVNKKGSFKRKRFFRSPLLSKEMCSRSGLPEQLAGGGETSALLLSLIWFTACASHTCPQQLHPFIVLLQWVRGGIQAGRGSEDAPFPQKLQLMVTMVTVHPEVDVVQVLGNDKGISLINKSLKHLQVWRVPALRKVAS